jgi:Na+/H+ antiporter
VEPSVLTIIWIVAFVIVTVAVTGLSRRVGWSAPISLVAVGAIVAYIPGIPAIHVEPQLILYALLPPLLFATAIRTSLVDVRARGDSILALSVFLVFFTVVSVGFFTWWLVPSITLATAFAFAAVVAPTDAVAVTAISGRLSLPRRVMTILEGESLFNDAAALVALSAAISAIVGVINPLGIGVDFVLAIVVGVAFGFGVGYGLSFIRRRIKSPVLDTSLSLVTPFVAFIPAQLLHGSGVLAVVIAGLIIGQHAPIVQSAESRIADSLNWRTIRFLLENSVFLFIGLNLKGILDGAVAAHVGVWATIGISVATLVFLFLSRTGWILLTTLIYRKGPQRLRARKWTYKNAFAVGFAGIRGVVTLAAVFLLPEQTPQRSFLQLLAFIVVVGTLLQGLALPWFIRRLKLPPANSDQEHVETQNLMAEARTAGVGQLEIEAMDSDDSAIVDRLRADALIFSQSMEGPLPESGESSTVAFARLRLAMISAERQAVLAARAEGRYQEQAVRAVLATIDAEEIAVRVLGHKRVGDS